MHAFFKKCRVALSGELPSGTPLRLVELAKRLDMSQMPVREGLRRLEAPGLVDIIPLLRGTEPVLDGMDRRFEQLFGFYQVTEARRQ